jgi:hypothetical protein
MIITTAKRELDIICGWWSSASGRIIAGWIIFLVIETFPALPMPRLTRPRGGRIAETVLSFMVIDHRMME